MFGRRMLVALLVVLMTVMALLFALLVIVAMEIFDTIWVAFAVLFLEVPVGTYLFMKADRILDSILWG